MKMKLSNYFEPTPKLFKKIGDSVMLGATSLSVMVPSTPFSADTKMWMVIGLNIFGVFGKILTNFFKEEDSKSDGN